MEGDPVAKAAIRVELLQYKNSMRGVMISNTDATHTGGEAPAATTATANPDGDGDGACVGGTADEQLDPSQPNDNAEHDDSDLDM